MQFVAFKINSDKMIAPPRKKLSEAQAVEINQEFLDIYKNTQAKRTFTNGETSPERCGTID
jgi:hypothetical protein